MCIIRKCPLCENENSHRIKRKKLMKIIPHSKLYECHDCYANYLVVLEKFKIIIDKGYSQLFLSFSKVNKFPEITRIKENLI